MSPDRHRTAGEGADELLEAVWTCRERGEAGVEAVLGEAHTGDPSGAFEEIRRQGLAELRGGQIELTPDGERRAAAIIRRHRLAEHLLVSALGMSAEQTEKLACAFEHDVSPEVIDSICTLMGHPRLCPHGKPIPPGSDCVVKATRPDCALVPLTEVPAGQAGKVSHLRTRDHERLHQLLSLGIAPGVQLRVHQRTPLLVVQMDESEFAMDRDVARDIYVWHVPA
jgi:DtxR family Mn-dependent transcriptional regulator